MGTRSLTVFTDAHDKEIVVMYRQYDGYISQHGKELGEFLQQFDEVVNGLVGDNRKQANGMACLAAQTIMHFKERIKNHDYSKREFDSKTGVMKSQLKEGHHEGGIYLFAAGSRDCGEEYIYYISESKGRIHLRVCIAGRPEYTYDDETFPAVEDEYIWAGLTDNWNLDDALAMEKHIHDRRETVWLAEQELTQ
mgnify:CR=1 FL=1|tara:strand:+ start:382 stop:963 length:582 start_codon:yes stop_codon:yes gene_type:complete